MFCNFLNFQGLESNASVREADFRLSTRQYPTRTVFTEVKRKSSQRKFYSKNFAAKVFLESPLFRRESFFGERNLICRWSFLRPCAPTANKFSRKNLIEILIEILNEIPKDRPIRLFIGVSFEFSLELPNESWAESAEWSLPVISFSDLAQGTRSLILARKLAQGICPRNLPSVLKVMEENKIDRKLNLLALILFYFLKIV